MAAWRMVTAGDQGLVVEFGNTIDEQINRRVHGLRDSLQQQQFPGVKELIPTYRSLFISFDPLVISREELSSKLEDRIAAASIEAREGRQRVIHIPVCYGGDYGPDISFVASYHSLTVEQVVQLHTASPYLVYMLGFTPGFPYLGGMAPQLATPRLERPRTVIPAGSVGIAGSQTGFYPVASPGGWQLIGRTPVKAFNPRQPQPFLFQAGDYLQFYSISPQEFEVLTARLDYVPRNTWLEQGGETE